MPRRRKPPRLYLDPKRKRWAIRDGSVFKRTRCSEEQRELAERSLASYVEKKTVWKRPPRLRNIYFITCDVERFPIKIGMSGNVVERMRDVRTGLPYEVVLLGTIPGTSKDETRIQQRFASSKLRGEWFKRTPELMEYIKCSCAEARATEKMPTIETLQVIDITVGVAGFEPATPSSRRMSPSETTAVFGPESENTA